MKEGYSIVLSMWKSHDYSKSNSYRHTSNLQKDKDVTLVNLPISVGIVPTNKFCSVVSNEA